MMAWCSVTIAGCCTIDSTIANTVCTNSSLPVRPVQHIANTVKAKPVITVNIEQLGRTMPFIKIS